MNLNRIVRYIIASQMIIFFFIVGTSELKASACPNGFTPRTVQMNINGCTYEVNICVKCQTGIAPAEIQIRDFSHIVLSPECEQTWTIYQVLDYIANQLSTYSFIYAYLCTPLTAPPCPAQSDIHIFRHWVCWNIEVVYYFGKYHIKHTPCDYDNYCEERYKYCYDPIANQNVKTRVYGPALVGSINCTLEASEVEIPDQIDQPTDCYIYHTPCNP
jgi:hypothetical protein